jgi:1,2-diacylglycerol 3-beta-galactosyltransferase
MGQRARRLLLLFADTGGGHRSAAYAVAQALQERYDEQAEVELVDALADFAPWPFKHLDTIYPRMVRWGGWPWASGYCLSDGPRRAELLTRSCGPLAREAANQLLQNHAADAIVCCHPALNHVLVRALQRRRGRAAMITLVADLATAHALWFAPGVSRCLVPTEDVRQCAMACGLPAERILVTGLPVNSQFISASSQDPLAVRRRLGLRTDRSMVLFLGGAEGMGPLRRLCQAVVHSGAQAQLVVIAGRNGRLQRRLSAAEWPLPVRVEGFVHNMHEWMRAADLVVTKAGPSTISEALVVGLPLVLSGALPGQEQPNVDYIVRAGAGVWAPTPGQVAKTVRELISPGNKRLAQMAARAQTLAHPDAAQRVAETVWAAARPHSQ